jgi:hypothetical protein
LKKDYAVKLNRPLIALIALAALGGCAKKDHDLDESGGVSIKRSSCPAVAVAVNTGDVTLFNPTNSRDSRAIDVVANITNVQVNCNEGVTGDIVSSAHFEVQARRTDATGARDVVLPYFSTVVQGGNIVISKRISTVGIHFNDGQLRASTAAVAGASIDRAAATIPLDIITRVNRKRKSGQDDASIDPLADPVVRDQINRANFELLIGFQLTNDQLQYNATR